MIKVMTIFGTRPEVISCSRVMAMRNSLCSWEIQIGLSSDNEYVNPPEHVALDLSIKESPNMATHSEIEATVGLIVTLRRTHSSSRTTCDSSISVQELSLGEQATIIIP